MTPKALLKAAIRDNNPVIFLESELTYGMKGEVPDEEYVIPLGKADIKRQGTDVTLVSWGKQVFNCLTAAKQLESQGISAGIVISAFCPLDHETLFASVVKTGRVVIVQEGHLFCQRGRRSGHTHSTSLLRLARCPHSACSESGPLPAVHHRIGKLGHAESRTNRRGLQKGHRKVDMAEFFWKCPRPLPQ